MTGSDGSGSWANQGSARPVSPPRWRVTPATSDTVCFSAATRRICGCRTSRSSRFSGRCRATQNQPSGCSPIWPRSYRPPATTRPPAWSTRPSTTRPRRYRMFEAVADWLVDLSSSSPVTMIVDDVHWASDSTLQLLGHLQRRRNGGAVTFVLTSRDTAPDVNPRVLRPDRSRLGSRCDGGPPARRSEQRRRNQAGRRRRRPRRDHAPDGGQPVVPAGDQPRRRVCRHAERRPPSTGEPRRAACRRHSGSVRSSASSSNCASRLPQPIATSSTSSTTWNWRSRRGCSTTSGTTGSDSPTRWSARHCAPS